MSGVRNCLPWVLIVALLLGIDFWGKHQRYREWWWISGDRDGMLFLDLAHASDGEGHILSTDGDSGDEFAVQWNCKNGTVRWGAMWIRDRDFNQVERRAAPKDLREWHTAKDASETRLLQIACAKPSDRSALRSVKSDRQPIEATKKTLEAVRKGVKPHEALFTALGVG